MNNLFHDPIITDVELSELTDSIMLTIDVSEKGLKQLDANDNTVLINKEELKKAFYLIETPESMPKSNRFSLNPKY